MAKTVIISIFTLVAGFCLGLLFNFGFFSPGTSLPPNNLAAAANITAANSPAAPVPLPSDQAEIAESDNSLLLEQAYKVAAAMRDQDYQTLSLYVHPTQGVIFTPYSTVDLQANLCFLPSQIAGLAQDSQNYVWGISDGKGDPLTMTMSKYFARYVYNADYTQAPILGIDRVIGSGNALENVSEVFPEARFVEFYFPSLAPEHNGFDWCGLKLVFSVYEGEYKLIAVIHSEWTI